MREVIVSYSDSTSKRQLYRVNEDGSARRRITDGIMPDWSRDGQKIVYLKEAATGNSIWVSDPNGNYPIMLVASGLNMKPSWAPDSKHIVWFTITSGKSEIKILNTETLQSRPLFTDPDQVRYSNMMPVISPDGAHIAFVSNRTGHYRIWVSNLDGSNARPVSPAETLDWTLGLPNEQKVPSWSPDGKWIAHWEGVEMDYLSNLTGVANPQRDMLIENSWNVWVINPDGSSKYKAGHGDDPIWSPDGFLTRSFPDPVKGGANVMIEEGLGWRELPIVPPNMPLYGRFTWRPW